MFEKIKKRADFISDYLELNRESDRNFVLEQIGQIVLEGLERYKETTQATLIATKSLNDLLEWDVMQEVEHGSKDQYIRTSLNQVYALNGIPGSTDN